MDKIMKMNRRKRQLVTHTIAESSRIQTKKFFVRENIKKQLLKEREEVSLHPPNLNPRSDYILTWPLCVS